MKITKYILLSTVLLVGFTACNEPEDVLADYNIDTTVEELPTLEANGLDFSSYVSLGASFTAGFSDGGLFKAAQQNSFPNILASQFANVNNTGFSQPLMNDNIGGLLFGGNVIQGPRLFFNGEGPATLPATPTTEITAGTPGPYNNMGVPGAKSFHLLYNGYGNPQNLLTNPATANPYFVRMASSGSATMLGDAMSQNPSFFTLSEIGGNDVLGYATTGGDGSNPITPPSGVPGVGFDQTFGAIVTTLTSGGAKGVITNVPYITDLPHFTTVPHNPIPLDAATAGALNSVQAYGAYNAGVAQALAYLVSINQIPQSIADAELAKRTISFSAGEGNAVVIMDESLINLTAINPALISMRQATAQDLLVLPAASFIGTLADPNNPLSVNGVGVPLGDKWVLTPEEQTEIKNATDAYNTVINGVAASNPNVALVDLNAILTQASTNGIQFDDYIMNTDLVFGGLVSLDGIHLTARGYALMANEFLKAIDAKFGSNFIESGTTAKAGDYVTNYPATLQ